LRPRLIFSPRLSESQRKLKRLIDLTVLTLTIPITVPLLALIAICVFVDSPGPILFLQVRLGEGGRLFRIWKFRTMIPDRRRLASPLPEGQRERRVAHKSERDPRVTRLGWFLRRTSLDELPQLVNVLKGDMSLVGPRPELPQIAAENYADWQYQRFSVPQGLTGWWQVNGRSDRPLHEHSEDDIYYVEHYSPWLDVLIMAKTIPAVIGRKGAF
jgi:lipopolysaccharide/colanic/teichoic acid biosynthesis glycosyltransferase